MYIFRQLRQVGVPGGPHPIYRVVVKVGKSLVTSDDVVRTTDAPSMHVRKCTSMYSFVSYESLA